MSEFTIPSEVMDKGRAYIIGYIDGYQYGVERKVEPSQEDIKPYTYRNGYERGVADYCRIELGEEGEDY